MTDIDVLMITYNRPTYTRLSLQRLLDTCDEEMRVWVWHNGTDTETLDVVRGFLGHPRLHRFHHSVENQRLRAPTNWLFTESQASFVAKVDDDCLMPHGWADTLRAAHVANAAFGAIGCWHFPEEDFVPGVATRKIIRFNNDHRVMVNCWVAGSGYLMKRACIAQQGPIRDGESFTQYGIRLARRGWVNGWYFPFLFQEHMDDPRSQHTLLRTDDDLRKWVPLSSRTFGAESLAAWQAAIVADAHYLQRASTDPAHFCGWRGRVTNLRRQVERLARGGSEPQRLLRQMFP